jgi:hypothetical protein
MRETHLPQLPPLVTGSRTDLLDHAALPDHAALAALRAWYAGVPTREAVVRYLPESISQGHAARRVMSEIRRQLIRCALARHRDDLAALFAHRSAERVKQARRVAQALKRGAQLTSVRDNLRHASISTTSIYLHSDEVERARQFRDAFKAG